MIFVYNTLYHVTIGLGRAPSVSDVEVLVRMIVNERAIPVPEVRFVFEMMAEKIRWLITCHYYLLMI